MKRIARVVSGHHEFGRVSGGSDFPAGQMAALCGQCVWCVCCVWGCGAVRRGPAAAAARWRERLLTLWLSPESQSHLNFWFVQYVAEDGEADTTHVRRLGPPQSAAASAAPLIYLVPWQTLHLYVDADKLVQPRNLHWGCRKWKHCSENQTNTQLMCALG